ncbi:MAG: TadE/TadG family type IV pilus assembly protein [Blastocatellia bacterium]
MKHIGAGKNGFVGGRRGRGERGAQLVELAIVLPVLLLLVAVIVEFGQSFYTYTTLAKATRAAARYLSSKPTTTAEQDTAKRMAVCGNPSSCTSQSPVISGLTTSNIQISMTGSVNFPNTITVRVVGYRYQPILMFGYYGGSSLSDVEVSPSTTMRYTRSN